MTVTLEQSQTYVTVDAVSVFKLLGRNWDDVRVYLALAFTVLVDPTRYMSTRACVYVYVCVRVWHCVCIYVVFLLLRCGLCFNG